MKLHSLLFLITTLVIGCSQNKVKDESPKPETPQQTIEFNKDLFSGVYRAAATLQASGEGAVRLKTELTMIEPRLQTESERAVYVILEEFMQVEMTSYLIRGIREGNLKSAASMKRLHPDAISIMRNLNKKGAEHADRLEESEKMIDAGYVLVYDQYTPDTRQVLKAMKKYQFPIKECKCFSWVPYESSLEALEALSFALLKTAGEMIYNNGSVKEGRNGDADSFSVRQ